MGVPSDLHPIAHALETDPNLWRTLLAGNYPVTDDSIIPSDIQNRIVAASKQRCLPRVVADELRTAMHAHFTFEEFDRCRHALASGKSLGPSGLTSTQMKTWGLVTCRDVFDLSALMWEHHHIPTWLVILLPKEQGNHDLAKIRPISLFEII
jgi:hypothetical protein